MQKDLGITGNLYWATSIQLTKEGADRDIWNYPFASNYRAGDGFLIYSGVEGDGVINRNTLSSPRSHKRRHGGL